MYLFERLFGLLVYYVTLLIFCIILSKIKDNKKIKRILLYYLICLCTISYFYLPAATADLSRHYESLELYSSISYSSFLDLLLTNNSPLSLVFFRYIGMTNNYHLLPFFTCLIYYGILFSLLNDFCKRYDINGKDASKSLFFLMIGGKLLGIISGVRNGIAFMLLIKCFYNEFILNKSIFHNIIYYLSSILMHPSSLIIIAIRFIFMFFEKQKSFVKKVFNVFLIICFGFLFVKYGQNLLNYTLEKGLSYINGGDYFYIWEHLISFIYIFFTIIILLSFRKKINCDTNIKKLSNFILFLCIITLAFSFEHSIFTRFQGFISLMFVFYFSFFLKEIRNLKIKSLTYSFLYYFVIILILIISITRGDITGLKFFIY